MNSAEIGRLVRWVLVPTAAMVPLISGNPAAAVAQAAKAASHHTPMAAQTQPSPQGVCPPLHLRDEDGKVIDPINERNADRPYSPRQTCGQCHDYEKITRGYHFTQGRGERPTADQANRCAWARTVGRICNPPRMPVRDGLEIRPTSCIDFLRVNSRTAAGAWPT